MAEKTSEELKGASSASYDAARGTKRASRFVRKISGAAKSAGAKGASVVGSAASAKAAIIGSTLISGIILVVLGAGVAGTVLNSTSQVEPTQDQLTEEQEEQAKRDLGNSLITEKESLNILARALGGEENEAYENLEQLCKDSGLDSDGYEATLQFLETSGFVQGGGQITDFPEQDSGMFTEDEMNAAIMLSAYSVSVDNLWGKTSEGGGGIGPEAGSGSDPSTGASSGAEAIIKACDELAWPLGTSSSKWKSPTPALKKYVDANWKNKWRRKYGASCDKSVFVAVKYSGYDPKFKKNLEDQINPKNWDRSKWQLVQGGKNAKLDTSLFQAGDIIVTDKKGSGGHICIIYKAASGKSKKCIVAEGSYTLKNHLHLVKRKPEVHQNPGNLGNWHWRPIGDGTQATGASQMYAPASSEPARDASKEERASYIYSRLLSAGYPHNAACGVLGNLECESGFNPKAKGGKYIGIAQWGGSRATRLKKYAKQQGKDWTRISVQVSFMLKELSGNYKSAGKKLKDQSISVEKATSIVMDKYLGAGAAADARLKNAKAWSKKMKNNPPVADAGTDPAARATTYKKYTKVGSIGAGSVKKYMTIKAHGSHTASQAMSWMGNGKFVVVTTPSNGATSTLSKYENKEFVKKTDSTNARHSNGMAYNPDNDRVYITRSAIGGGDRRVLTAFKGEDLGSAKNVNLKGCSASSLGYDVSTKRYVIQQTHKIIILNNNFKVLKKVNKKGTNYKPQDSNCFNGVAFCVTQGASNIDMYRMSDAKYLGTITTSLGELESVCVDDEGYFLLLGSHRQIWRSKKKVSEFVDIPDTLVAESGYGPVVADTNWRRDLPKKVEDYFSSENHKELYKVSVVKNKDGKPVIYDGVVDVNAGATLDNRIERVNNRRTKLFVRDWKDEKAVRDGHKRRTEQTSRDAVTYAQEQSRARQANRPVDLRNVEYIEAEITMTDIVKFSMEMFGVTKEKIKQLYGTDVSGGSVIRGMAENTLAVMHNVKDFTEEYKVESPQYGTELPYKIGKLIDRYEIVGYCGCGKAECKQKRKELFGFEKLTGAKHVAGLTAATGDAENIPVGSVVYNPRIGIISVTEKMKQTQGKKLAIYCGKDHKEAQKIIKKINGFTEKTTSGKLRVFATSGMTQAKANDYWNNLIGGGSTQLVQVASKEIGNAGGSKYKSWYGGGGAWCAMFVSWCANQCGYIKAGKCPKTAAADGFRTFGKEHGCWKDSSYTPKPGDIILFDYEPNGVANHVGIVEKVEGGKIHTIEGNYSNRVSKVTRSKGEVMGYMIIK